MKSSAKTFFCALAAFIILVFVLILYAFLRSESYWDFRMQSYTHVAKYHATAIDQKLGQAALSYLTKPGETPDRRPLDALFKASSLDKKVDVVVATAFCDNTTVRHVSGHNSKYYSFSDALTWIRMHPDGERFRNRDCNEFFLQLDFVSKQTEWMSENFVFTGSLLGSSDFNPGIDGLVVKEGFNKTYLLPSDFDKLEPSVRSRVQEALAKMIRSNRYSSMEFRRIRAHAYKYNRNGWMYLNEI